MSLLLLNPALFGGVARAVGVAVKNVSDGAQDVTLGAAYALGNSAGAASAKANDGFNVVKWVGVGLAAVAVITVAGFLKEAVD